MLVEVSDKKTKAEKKPPNQPKEHEKPEKNQARILVSNLSKDTDADFVKTRFSHFGTLV